MGRLSRGQSTASGPSAVDRFYGDGYADAFSKAGRKQKSLEELGRAAKQKAFADALRRARGSYRKPFTGRPPSGLRGSLGSGTALGRLGALGAAAEALSSLDPDQTNQWARDFNDAYGMYTPAALFDDFLEWWSQPTKQSARYAWGSEWVLDFSGSPDAARPVPSIDIIPKPVSGWGPNGTLSPAVYNAACSSNQNLGVTIPATATVAWLARSSLPGPAYGGNRAYEKRHRAAAGAAVAFSTPRVTVPYHPAVPEEPEVSENAAYSRSVGMPEGVGFNFGSGGQGGSRPIPPSNPGPPPPGVRERKFKMGKGGVAGDIFGAWTEFSDALSCAVGAIKGNGGPKTHGPQGGHLGLAHSVEYVAKHFDITNLGMVEDFMSCMVQNQVQDFAIGKLNSAAGRAFGQASGSPRGVGIKRGPSPF